ncbi:MAG: serine/threonine-protein phosphatase [Acidobacteria bacterium]|nr:serine/threonine-protein phosphatase [Acidobacteriota bacterium]
MSKFDDWSREELIRELEHVQSLASLILPRSDRLPTLKNIDYHAAIEPLAGSVSGDHLIVVNFAEYHLNEKIAKAKAEGDEPLAIRLRKNFDRFGILIADAAGHRIGDSITANFLHGAFKTGVAYELARNGVITRSLFEMLNTIFYNRMQEQGAHDGPPQIMTPDVPPYLTLIYGEVRNDGRFRYLSAGHPPPIVFSQKFDRIVTLYDDRTRASMPLGIFPSDYHVDIEHFGPSAITKKRYSVNEINLLGEGDIMLLYTDAVTEHEKDNVLFKDARLEQVLRKTKSGTAKEIYEAIVAAMRAFAPIEDDLTIAVIKKM